MKRPASSVLFLALFIGSVQSQVINITFEGTVNGMPTPLDSILVMNLTQGGDTTIYFPENSLVLGTTGLHGATGGALAFTALPNPFAGVAEVLLDAGSGEVLLTLHDATGRELARHASSVGSGRHRIRVSCDRPGLHVLTVVQGGVSHSMRLMATEGAGASNLSYVDAAGRIALKADRSLFTWMSGDELRYITYSTSGEIVHSAALQEVPVGTTSLEFVLTPGIVCPESPTVTDSDGNIYHARRIGGQCWMADNLRTTSYSNGDPLTQVPIAQWGLVANDGTGGWGYHNDNAAFEVPYGKLYNRPAIMDPRGVCPSGWRVPTPADWGVLIEYLGGYEWPGSAGMLKSNSSLWDPPNSGATNETGFSAEPAGGCSYHPSVGTSCSSMGTAAYYWQYTANQQQSVGLGLLTDYDQILPFGDALPYTQSARSVRCIKE